MTMAPRPRASIMRQGGPGGAHGGHEVERVRRRPLLVGHGQEAVESRGHRPTLLTRMSSRPKPRRRRRPGGPARRGGRGRRRRRSTVPDRASASSSADGSRAPATTVTPSSASTRVMARPMPLLAPVTMATCPARPEVHAQSPCSRSQASTASAISLHPLSIVSECPRPSNCELGDGGEFRYCLSVDRVTTSGTVWSSSPEISSSGPRVLLRGVDLRLGVRARSWRLRPGTSGFAG